MIKIVNTIDNANCVTHSGKFHADDVFSTILLEKIINNVYLFRTYEIKADDNSNIIYYDIGGGMFDHHHIKNNEMRNDFIPYASFGLLWRHYYKEILKDFSNIDIDYVFNYIDKNLVVGIDAVDNGVFYKCDMYNIMDISTIISMFNPNYDEDISSDEKFIEACNTARTIFNNILNKAISLSKSKNIIENLIANIENHTLILEEYIPFREHILNSDNIKANDIYFVIYKSNRCGYMISTLPISLNNDKLRVAFPSNWAGLRGEEFAKVCNISDVIFCHKNLFVASTCSLSSAIKLVNIVLNNKNNNKT